MALQFEANYSKKLGLPGYSSHQFSVSLKTELNDVSQIQAETSRLYALLQSSVDRELQQTGFLPTGEAQKAPQSNGNGCHQPINNKGHSDTWQCSPKQRDLIIKIVDDNRLDKSDIESLAHERFGKGVRALNKLEASGLIEELLEKYPSQQSTGRNGRYQQARSR